MVHPSRREGQGSCAGNTAASTGAKYRAAAIRNSFSVIEAGRTTCGYAWRLLSLMRNRMPTRFWFIVVLSFLAGLAVMLAKPTGRKARSSVPWRGQIKPPPPPP